MPEPKDELDLDNQDPKVSLSEERIKDLSTKVKLTSKERDDLAEAKKQMELERDGAIKERDFANSFADVIGQYPNAKEHKEDIKSKVLAGYTVEDATVSVLNKAGKLTQPRVETDIPAGGSASNPPPRTASKKLSEATKEELRQAITDNDADIMEFLRTGR